MENKKFIAFLVAFLAMIILLPVTQLTGCSPEKTGAGQIAPLTRENIKIIYINSGNSLAESSSDPELIDAVIDQLDHIQFSRMSREQEAEVLDEGRVFNLKTTLTVQLLEKEQGPPQATIVMPSDLELLLADSATMEKSRTVLYHNQTDELSLDAAKQIYLLALQALEAAKEAAEEEGTEETKEGTKEGTITARYWLGDAGERTIEYLVRLLTDGKKDLVNVQGETILSGFDDYDLMLKLIFARQDGKWGLYEPGGGMVLDHVYEEIANYEMPNGCKANGLAGVKSGGLWGAVDQNGKIVIQPRYDSILLNYYEEVEPFIKVEKDGKFGYVTQDGQLLVDTVWDAAFMDVLNVPEDIIFVQEGGKWGGIRVENAAALPVDWNLQPSEQAKLSFNEWKYDYQWDFYTHQILSGETEITPVTKIFFHDYFSKNSMELRLLPVFSPGGTPEWGELSNFIIANTPGEWANGFMTEEEFKRYTGKYFDNITLAPKPGSGLSYQDGKYTFAGGFSFHGSLLYELTKLEKGKTEDGRDKWKADIKGYYFHELDGSSENDEYQSKNARVIWEEMKKEENKRFSFWEVRDRLVVDDPGSKLDLGCEWTVEFTVNNPKDDLHFTYLSCRSKWRITN